MEAPCAGTRGGGGGATESLLEDVARCFTFGRWVVDDVLAISICCERGLPRAGRVETLFELNGVGVEWRFVIDLYLGLSRFQSAMCTIESVVNSGPLRVRLSSRVMVLTPFHQSAPHSQD